MPANDVLNAIPERPRTQTVHRCLVRLKSLPIESSVSPRGRPSVLPQSRRRRPNSASSRVVVMSAVDDVFEIAVFAPQWLFELDIGDLQIPNPALPRFGEHGRIVRRHSVL